MDYVSLYGCTIFPFYDDDGNPLGFYLLDYDTHWTNATRGVAYYYVRNAQGDVVQIRTRYNETVANYHYDAWGKLLSVTDANGNILTEPTDYSEPIGANIAFLNPIRYRGYVYDNETGFYYLNSRYYDPEVGRFINADTTDILTATPDSLTDKNLYAYCDNNPVMRKDDGGEFWHLIVGAVVGVATQYVSDVVTNLIDDKSFTEALKPTSTLADYGSAALSGALAASGVGKGVSIVANAALGGATYLTNCAIKGEDANIVDLGLSIGAGATSGFVGGRGANGAELRGIARTSKQILKTTVSPKKIAMYTAKLNNVKRKAIISTFRTVAAGLTSNRLNYRRRLLTNSLS